VLRAVNTRNTLMMEAGLPKRLYISTGLYGVTSRTTAVFKRVQLCVFLYLYSYSRYLLSIQYVTTVRHDCPKGIGIVHWRAVNCPVTEVVNMGRV